MKPRANAWTERQDQLLHTYPGLSDEAMGERLGKSPSAVAERRLKLGLRKNEKAWTKDRVALLKKLDAEGVSDAEKAAQLGVTRNAVIGKLHRLKIRAKGVGRGISPRKAQSHLNQKPKAAPAPKVAAGPVPTPDNWKPRLVAVPADSRPVELADLGASQCRWPLDDPGPGNMDRVLFCAAPAEGRYCRCHCTVAFKPTPATGPKSISALARSLRRYA